MDGLDSSLNTMDLASRQRLFKLATWDADKFISDSCNLVAAAAVRLMYSIYDKPEAFRGPLPGVTLPSLTTDEQALLDQGLLPSSIISAVESTKSALGITARP